MAQASSEVADPKIPVDGADQTEVGNDSKLPEISEYKIPDKGNSKISDGDVYSVRIGQLGSPDSKISDGDVDNSKVQERNGSRNSFAKLVMILQVSFLILFALLVKFPDPRSPNISATDWDKVDMYYPMYQDVHVMVFVGFGFLMTFLAKYSWSSVAYNMLVACLCIQWGILMDGFWRCALEGEWTSVTFGIESAILGDFTAATVLISFGAVLGRITPTQLLVMALLEIPFLIFNEQFCIQKFEAVDMGGSIFIHTFGAYFGLAVSAVIGDPKCLTRTDKSVYHSDLMAMIGTIFLFVFWPSFNAAMCPNNNFAKERVILNTVLAISASCMMAFACSRLFGNRSKFKMVHIQNATLAGGVAVGTSSDLILSPYTAVMIGMIAGTLSTYGFVFISPWLQRNGFWDTCGIHNLHGLPGLLGGFASIFTSWLHGDSEYGDIGLVIPARGDGRGGSVQAGYQFAALFMTFFLAVISGLIVGRVLIMPWFAKEINAFCDEPYWQLDHKAYTADRSEVKLVSSRSMII